MATRPASCDDLRRIGMDFLEPLKIAFSELDQEITFPFISEKDTLVLLKVATMKQMPEEMFLLPLAFRTLTCSMFAPNKSAGFSFFSVEEFSFSGLESPFAWFRFSAVSSFFSAFSWVFLRPTPLPLLFPEVFFDRRIFLALLRS